MHSRRLGLMGGTFDPIHWGHLDAAEAAAGALGLTDLCFVPSHVPPHRPVQPQASGFHRFAMTALAIQDIPGARVSDIELSRPGPSYSAETLAHLHTDGWRPSQIFFVIGSDAFAEIATWRGYPALLDLCHFAVISRAGAEPEAATGGPDQIQSRLSTPALLRSQPTRTCVVPVAALTRPTSSSEVRARVAGGRTVTDLVPPPVAAYISQQGLYRPGQQFA
ncbi:MAG: nicotinate-nucleotide adenylyltransferase [Vicinamibacterales bacterium]